MGNQKSEMPFLDHLEELRWRILKAAGALATGSVIGYLLVRYFNVMEMLVRPVRPYLAATSVPGLTGAQPEIAGKLLALSPATPFFLELKLAVLVGVVLSLPIIIYQVWAFLAPALEAHEKRVMVPSLYLGMMLFGAGVMLAYFVALPVSLRFFYSIQTDYIAYTLEASEYLGFVVRLLVGFGALFELPVVVMILTAVGLTTPAFLRSKRRHAAVVLAVVAAFLSPGDMVIVTALMVVPLMLLYELSIGLSALIVRNRGGSALGSLDPPEGSVEYAQ